MFDRLSELEMTDDLFLHLEYTQDLLSEYLSDVISLEGKKPGLVEFLKALRSGDVVDNQDLERENMFLVILYSQLSRETAMGRLIRYVKSDKQLTGRDLFSLNNTLLYGTLSEGVASVRDNNARVVGKFVNGERIIDYFPIDYRDVRVAADKIADIYNGRLTGELYDNVFIQPFLIHGLLGALQLFNDGNTRMGRVMQHSLIWQLINERMGYQFEMPPLYATKNYFASRDKYRELIANLVKVGDNKAWSDWFEFNLYKVEDTIYTGRENIRVLKRKMEFGRPL